MLLSKLNVKIILMASFAMVTPAMAQDWGSVPIPASAGAGKYWETDWNLSDEFNYDSGTSAGQAAFGEKWQDFKPNYFLGPGATYFSKDHWSVADGALKISASRVPEQNQIVNTTHPDFMRTTYTGYVTSKIKLQPGSYTEVLLKGSRTPLSSNFWMIDDTDTTEIDVLEIYGDGDSNWYPRNPRTNVHFQIRENGQVVENVANQMFHPKDNIVYAETWHRYGVNWMSETDLEFYYDGELVRTLNLPSEIVDPRGLYLNEDVRLILNLEAHHWRGEDGIPSDTELNDETINNMQVDWIRTYRAADITGDFDADGDVDIDDIDLLSNNIGSVAQQNPAMDLDGDGDITLTDHDQLISTLVQTAVGTGALIGDLNLDGDVDVSQFDTSIFKNVGDASILLGSLGTSSGASYGDGDLNGDGDVDVSQFDPLTFTNVGDASQLLAALGQTQGFSTRITSAIPEPDSTILIIAIGVAQVSRRR